MPGLVLGDKYARAGTEVALAQPVVFPLVQSSAIPALLELVDGVMLTGSPSNVHPSHFGEAVADVCLPLDEARDAITLALVNACVAAGVPLLGVCRGFQEINVALGGSLHQRVHAASHAQQYASRHPISIRPGSRLAEMAAASSVVVNSLHGQGIHRLAQGLTALAHAPDGLVEAFEVSDAPGFTLAVQWHPEWRAAENPFYTAIFKAFGDACRARKAVRQNLK
ncbi:MAG: gamma-glutamyl-gamma-aminobutyrate hydrolase [Burkholderiales bacterium PBB4]|nr:MAG: gamma-glutamyl-gamma-aminobutyrate hydrolase [Burkholderiales bacterium PBB4]